MFENKTLNVERLKDIYTACIYFVDNNHSFPSYRWIIANTDIPSTSMVKYYLDKLVYRNLLEITEDKKYKFVGSVWLLPQEPLW